MLFPLLALAVLAVALKRVIAPPPPATLTSSQDSVRTVTQEVRGVLLTLTLVRLDGTDFYVAAEVHADAEAMRMAAFSEGAALTINSAWRTNAEQAEHRQKYLAGKGPVAAPIGWSHHEDGRALDIESGGGTNAAYNWLVANAARFGFSRTVSSEPWHWEHA